MTREFSGSATPSGFIGIGYGYLRMIRVSGRVEEGRATLRVRVEGV